MSKKSSFKRFEVQTRQTVWVFFVA